MLSIDTPGNKVFKSGNKVIPRKHLSQQDTFIAQMIRDIQHTLINIHTK
jgi:hypothetical protein